VSVTYQSYNGNMLLSQTTMSYLGEHRHTHQMSQWQRTFSNQWKKLYKDAVTIYIWRL